MPTPSRFFLVFLWIFVPGLLAAAPLEPAEFMNPSDASALRVWWHWLDGNISRDGITRDLEAMKGAGLRTVSITDLGVRLPTGPVKEVLDKDWLAMVRFAAAEARRLDLKIELPIHPGFSGAGGPWITPEMSMKRLVWADLIVTGGRDLDLVLPGLPTSGAWSRDSVVLAWPVRGQFASFGPETVTLEGKVVSKSALEDGNPFTRVACPRSGSSWRFEFEFPSGKNANHVRLLFGEADHFVLKNNGTYLVRVLADGKPVQEIRVDEAAFRAPLELSFPPVVAMKYSLSIETHGEPFDFGGKLFLAEAEFLGDHERPRWSGAIKDWDCQVSDASGLPVGGGSFSDTAAAEAIQAGAVVDLTAKVREGRLHWEGPPGQWRIVRFGYMSNGKEVRPGRPGGQGLESDKMSERATDLDFQGYAQRVLDALPPEDRAVFSLLLIDSWECGKQNWTDDFPEAFAAHRGYSMVTYLPALAGEIVDSPSATGAFLNDFRQTIADLITERFYGRAKTLANAAGLKLEAQIGDGQGLDPDWDVFALARTVDLPMDEFWTENDTERLPRLWQLADAASLAGRGIVSSEAFTGRRADWLKTPGDMQPFATTAFLRGANQFVLHSFAHQPGNKPPGYTLGGNGEHFTRTNTWWPFVDTWFTALQRAQYLLQSTSPQGELLVYNGDTMPLPPALWPAGFATPHRQFIDHAALLSRVTVRDGKLQLDGQDIFQALVLPRSRSLKRDALEKIAELVRAGATVVGLPPEEVTGVSSPEDRRQFQELRAVLWNGRELISRLGGGRVIATDDPTVLASQINHTPAVLAEAHKPADQPLEYAHRRAGGVDVYVLRNPNDHRTGFTVRVTDAGNRRPELWWPESGLIEPLAAYFHEDGRVIFPVSLEGGSAVFLVLREPAPHDGLRGLRHTASDADPYSAADQVQMVREASEKLMLCGQAPGSVAVTAPNGEMRALKIPSPQLIPVSAPWQVSFGPQAANKIVRLQDLASWTTRSEPELRDYSGIAVYETTVEIPVEPLKVTGAAILDLGNVAAVARISINGQAAGTCWRAPWTVDVKGLLHGGANTIRVEVANLWQNRLIADLRLPVAQRITWTTPASENLVRQTGPLVSGLLGPVVIRLMPKIPL